VGQCLKRATGRTLTGVAITVGLLLALGGPAWAAGSTPGGFTDAVTTQTVDSSGGTVTGTVGTTSVKVTVPPGAFAAPVQIELSSGPTSGLTGLPSGSNATIALGVSFEQNDQTVTGTFNSPVTVNMSDAGITTANQIVVYDPATSSYVPVAQASNVTNATVSSGLITFQITADPYVVVLTSAASATAPSTVSDATTPVTGMPLVTEGVLGGVLVIGGTLLAVRLRRRSRRRLA
jgi:hypothetical protein